MIEQKGLKYDAGKLRLDLIPAEVIIELGKVLTYGAEKYAANSWQNVENGIDRYYGALMRHLFAWRSGEQVDPESGLPHLSHVLCNAGFLVWLTQNKRTEVENEK